MPTAKSADRSNRTVRTHSAVRRNGVPFDAVGSKADKPSWAKIHICPLWPEDRGRDASYLAPPAQNRTGPIRAYGSHLGCLTAKRASGQGGRIRGFGSQSLAHR